MSEEPPRADPNSPKWRWIALIVGLAGLILVLNLIFPNAVTKAGDWSAVGYSIGLVLLLCAGGLGLRGGPINFRLKHAAIWLAIIGGLTLLVTLVQGQTG